MILKSCVCEDIGQQCLVPEISGCGRKREKEIGFDRNAVSLLNQSIMLPVVNGRYNSSIGHFSRFNSLFKLVHNNNTSWLGKVGFNNDNAKDISHVVLLLYCCIQQLFLYDLLPSHATIIVS